MIIIQNKGMFLENVINRWCCLVNDKGKGYISKAPVNYKLLNSEKNTFTGLYDENNYCDYIGIYNSFYIEIEAKETTKDFFNINNISKKQIEKLRKIKLMGGLTLIIIYFHSYDKFYYLRIDDLKELIIKKIPLSWFEINEREIEFNNLNLNIDKIIKLIS